MKKLQKINLKLIEVGNFIEKDWEMKKEKINENEENKEQNFKFSDLIDNKKATFKAGQIMKRKEQEIKKKIIQMNQKIILNQ